MSREVVIVEGVRTPFVNAGRNFKGVHASDLGRTTLVELLAKVDIKPSEIDEVIIGNVGNPSDSANISRVIALRSGLPLKTSAFTVHRNCASALESITSGYERIKSGSLDVVVAGGTENMSQYPLLFTQKFQELFGEFIFAKTIAKKINALKRFKLQYLKPRFAVVEGLQDPFEGINMGQTAEILAKEFGISREEQDEFALKSHNKALRATESGRFKKEITPVFLPPQFKKVVADDMGPRKDQSMESLEKLKPYFDKRNGTVTVGNSCPLTDGAASVMLMSADKAASFGLKPLAKIRSYAYVGLQPKRMGLGPVFSTPKALDRAGLTLKDIDLIELNEAFAAQVLSCTKAFASDKFAQKELGRSHAIGEIHSDKLNVNGGAIALGHPVGATGTRLVLTLVKELKEQDKQFGLATLCIGGGQGGAMVLENI